MRLVSATGVLVSLMTLVCCWKIQQREEILVTIFATCYFTSTAYLSFSLQRRWFLFTAGTFLNALLLVVVLQWDTSTATGQTSPLMIAFSVLTFLWILFIAGQMRPRRKKRAFAKSHQGGY